MIDDLTIKKNLFNEIDEKFEMEFACRCDKWCTCWEEFKMKHLGEADKNSFAVVHMVERKTPNGIWAPYLDATMNGSPCFHDLEDAKKYLKDFEKDGQVPDYFRIVPFKRVVKNV